MPYPYGTQTAPAVGNGLGGLPRRITPSAPTPQGPQQFDLALLTTAKTGDAIFKKSDNTSQFVARRAIAPSALQPGLRVYDSAMVGGGRVFDDAPRRNLSSCVLQNGYTVIAYIASTTSNAYPFAQIFDANGNFVTSINVTASVNTCDYVQVCVSGTNEFAVVYHVANSETKFKRYNSAGTEVGTAVTVNSWTSCNGISCDWMSSTSYFAILYTDASAARYYVYNSSGALVNSGTLLSSGNACNYGAVAAIPTTSRWAWTFFEQSVGMRYAVRNSTGATVVKAVTTMSDATSSSMPFDIAGLSNDGFVIVGRNASSNWPQAWIYDSSGNAVTTVNPRTTSSQDAITVCAGNGFFTMTYHGETENYISPLCARTYWNTGATDPGGEVYLWDTHLNGVQTAGATSSMYSNGEMIIWTMNDSDYAVQYGYIAPVLLSGNHSFVGFALQDGVFGETIKAINPFV